MPKDTAAQSDIIAPLVRLFSAGFSNADQIQLHALPGRGVGKGPTVLLLHGYAETSRMWRPLMRLRAEKHTVIAPDLPGIGYSAIPRERDRHVTSAERIHAEIDVRLRGKRALEGRALSRPRIWKRDDTNLETGTTRRSSLHNFLLSLIPTLFGIRQVLCMSFCAVTFFSPGFGGNRALS